jgi:hypothetical protein
MNLKSGIIFIFTSIFFVGCEERVWNDHYYDQPETVDQNMWDVIQGEEQFSVYAGMIRDFNYDTLFLDNNPYTLFIPTNEALNAFLDTGSVTNNILDYHISQHFIQSVSISGKQKIQTLGEKFALFEKAGNEAALDGIPLEFESPLYRNGKYFTMESMAMPKPNLYEFFAVYNPVLRDYIDSQDSVVLDKELSRPIGFDEFGNTEYDTVSLTFNLFEEEFFPVSEEFRYKTATIVFPLEDDYNMALNEMAQSIGGDYQDHTDIPLKWQNEVLIPYLLDHGVFENMVEEYEFILSPGEDTLKMKNILGDSVVIEYEPADKVLCSNGYAYNYSSFRVPDTLFSGSYRQEGEWLLQRIGANSYAWNEEVTVISDISYPVVRELIPAASNDSILKVNFDKGYEGNYSVEFKIGSLFPRKYLMVVRTHMYVGGIFDIYVNDDDEPVMTMDWYDYVRNREIWFSVTGKVYKPEGAFNKFDCLIENDVAYGETTIRFVYTGSGNVQSNGLVIDYIDFLPYDE